MRAVLDDPALFDGDDAVGVSQGRETVGDQDHRAILADAAHVGLDRRLALVVQGRGRLVEDKDARIADQSSGDGDTLTLPAAQRGAPFADDGAVAFRQGRG